MFVIKNRNDPELSGPNFRARLNHSKQLLKIFINDASIISFTD